MNVRKRDLFAEYLFYTAIIIHAKGPDFAGVQRKSGTIGIGARASKYTEGRIVVKGLYAEFMDF